MVDKIAGIIPSRFGSSRFPGKPLALIMGKPMIQHVYEKCMASEILDHLYVATDDKRIQDVVESFGGNVIMTRTDHESGTDRLAEAVESIDSEIVVNIQGDQPFFNPIMIGEGVKPLLDDPTLEISTLMFPIERTDDLKNIGVVKMVVNLAGDAMYFSRSLIPYPHKNIQHNVYEHIGFYAYRKNILQKLAALPVTTLEEVESLEQLRWLEHGIRIHAVQTSCQDQAFSGFSIDTPEDLKHGEEMFRERQKV